MTLRPSWPALVVGGMILAIVVAGNLLVGKNTAAQQPAVSSAPPPPPPPPSEIGRYQIVINPNVRADTFLLDTVTGQVWTPKKYTAFKGEPVIWTLESRADNPTDLGLLLYGKTP